MHASQPRAHRWPVVDLLFSLVLVGLFVWAITQARAWPFRASLFPVMVSIFVLGMLALKIVTDVVRASRSRPAEPVATPASEALIEEEEASEAELEDVFASSARSTWLRALGWMSLFFVLLWSAGMLITIPVFALLYLVIEARERPWVAGIYAAISWVLIYGLFDQLLRIPLPTSAVLGFLGS